MSASSRKSISDSSVGMHTSHLCWSYGEEDLLAITITCRLCRCDFKHYQARTGVSSSICRAIDACEDTINSKEVAAAQNARSVHHVAPQARRAGTALCRRRGCTPHLHANAEQPTSQAMQWSRQALCLPKARKGTSSLRLAYTTSAKFQPSTSVALGIDDMTGVIMTKATSILCVH